MLKELLNALGLNKQVVQLQNEVSHLKNENDQLKIRLKELEVNFAFVSNKLDQAQSELSNMFR